ncbi:hypothetical protein ACFWP0_29530 [Achromobacter sp. NPDC058515]|uniref:hypothetical protein n=1 Tax=Achromobacter sp. NPDC058515 TaxID=3346533 RepID=UPI0036569AAE
MRDHAGTHYQYDARGNLVEKLHNGQRSRFEWDLFNRLTSYSNDTLHVSCQYDALGRRLIKQSEAHWRERPGMSHAQRQEERARLNRAAGCATTLYGWDGDTLAWEGRDDHAGPCAGSLRTPDDNITPSSHSRFMAPPRAARGAEKQPYL